MSAQNFILFLVWNNKTFIKHIYLFFPYTVSRVHDHSLFALVSVLGDLRQGTQNAHEGVQDTGESSNDELQPATGVKGNVRCRCCRMPVSINIHIKLPCIGQNGNRERERNECGVTKFSHQGQRGRGGGIANRWN